MLPCKSPKSHLFFRWPRPLELLFTLSLALGSLHLLSALGSLHLFSPGSGLGSSALLSPDQEHHPAITGAAHDAPTFFTSSSQPEPIFHFSPLASGNPFPLPFGTLLGNFTGTRSLHMSSHHCVGAYGGPGSEQGWANCTFSNFFCTDPVTGLYPNRTCRFTNLYFARIAAHPPPYSSYDWLYFAPVTLAQVQARGWDAGVERVRLQSQFRTNIHSRIHQDNWWRVSVVFFLEEPVSPSRASVMVNLVRPLPSPKNPRGGVVAGHPPARTVSDASQCTLLEAGGGVYKKSDVACLPPGVGAFTLRHFFLLHMTHHTNICHTLWDDLIPFAAAAQILGLPLHSPSDALLPPSPPFDFLLTCRPQEFMFRWDRTLPFVAWGMKDMGVRQAFAYASPGADPVQLGDVMKEAGDRLVHFPLVGGGLTAMSAHNFRPSYRVFGAEAPLRSVWSLRTHLMRGMGFTEKEIGRDVSALPSSSSSSSSSSSNTLSLLIVRGKRGIRNLASLVEGIGKKYPRVGVRTVAWGEAEVGGLLEEARLLSTTHVLLSLDGTVASKNLFLPPGAVFINLGVAQVYGSQYFLDFLHGAYDHIRVLPYNKLGRGEHEGHMLSSMTVPLEKKLAPYLEEAFALVTNRSFSVPLRLGRSGRQEEEEEEEEVDNWDANSRLLRFLFRKYPEFPYAGITLWHNASLRSKRVFVAAEEMYALATGKPAPQSLREDITAYCKSHPCDKRSGR